MIEHYSHILAFLVLSVAGIYDLRTTEVPDWLSVSGVIAGISIHAIVSYMTNSLEPIIWSLGVGTLFSAYGWGMYFTGMWGGADAFATSILGFAAPYGLSGISPLHAANLFINVMALGFLYSIGFAAYQGCKKQSVREEAVRRYRRDKFRIPLEFGVAIIVGVLAELYTGLNGYFYTVGIALMSLLYRYLMAVQSKAMTVEKNVEDLEEGEVVAEVDSKIRGASKDEIEKLDAEKVETKTGVKFIPVFPLALLITDLFGGGLTLMMLLIS